MANTNTTGQDEFRENELSWNISSMVQCVTDEEKGEYFPHIKFNNKVNAASS